LRTGSYTVAGRRVLVVEDDFLIANVIAEAFRAQGAHIVGPAGNLKDALAIAASKEHIDGAVLDVNLRGEMVYPVADVLRSKGVPIVFTTGYDTGDVVSRFADAPCLQKPFRLELLVDALFA
jgi:CheY-like chemotaxis protein